MEKTTAYVPADLKPAVSRSAQAAGLSQAEWMRKVLRSASATVSPEPRLPLLKSGKPHLAERIDAALEGFGTT